MFTCQTLLVLNQHRTMHHSSPRSPWQQNLCLSGSETARERASFKYSSAGAPVDGCPLMLICFRFPQLDALSHECAWTFAEAGQVSGLAGTRIPAAPHMFTFLCPHPSAPSYSSTRESLSQYVEGGAGQGPRAQSASVKGCLLFVGSWLLSSPSPLPFPLSLLNLWRLHMLGISG